MTEAKTLLKWNVLNRFSGEVQFTAEIDCKEDALPSVKLGLAVKWAIKTKANLSSADLSYADLSYADLSYADLRYANLSSADLRYADLSYANLSYADLRYANLRYANLSSADLRYANLRYANLSSADLRYANLRYANLSSADLRYADLRYANLSYADLRYANLRYANLSSADLRSFKADYWMVLTGAQAEVPGLIAALREGRVDGSTYEGECACLVGTIANVRHVDVHDLERDSSRPAEQWFLMIRNGDKPGDDTGGGFASAKALEWALEYAALTGIPIEAPAVTEIMPAA